MKIRRQAKSGIGERAARRLRKAIASKFRHGSAAAISFARDVRARLRGASHRERRRVYADLDRMIAAKP